MSSVVVVTVTKRLGQVTPKLLQAVSCCFPAVPQPPCRAPGFLTASELTRSAGTELTFPGGLGKSNLDFVVLEFRQRKSQIRNRVLNTDTHTHQNGYPSQFHQAESNYEPDHWGKRT